MRGKGKGQRFDYLFRRFDKVSSVLDIGSDHISFDEAIEQLRALYKEVANKEVFSDYEQHDKTNLLQQISWYFRFYEREIQIMVYVLFNCKKTDEERAIYKGYYWLVNGWNKARTFFTNKMSEANIFKSVASAKTSITKLLKIDSVYEFGYCEDEIYICDSEQNIIQRIKQKARFER